MAVEVLLNILLYLFYYWYNEEMANWYLRCFLGDAKAFWAADLSLGQSLV